MVNLFLVLVLLIAVSTTKGQQQHGRGTAAQQLQQQFNELVSNPIKLPPSPQTSVHVQQQQIELQSDSKVSTEEPPFRPISFPNSEENLTNDKVPPPNFSNLIYQNSEKHPPQQQQQTSTAPVTTHLVAAAAAAPASTVLELVRPTRVAIATAQNIPPNYTDDQLDYVRDFAWNLFQGSKLPSAIGNLVLCPIQPQLQLSLLRAAAAGLTESEIGQTINEVNPRVTSDLVSRLKYTKSDFNDLGIANAIFMANSLKLNSTFMHEAQGREVDILSVNFDNVDEAGYTINNWISNATKNQIKSIYKPDALRGVKVLLANTIYFSGEWKYGFNETKYEPFETTERLTKQVPMMKNIASLRAGRIQLRNGFTGEWVELPYRGDQFSMVVILPQQRHYLDDFIRSMRASDFADVCKQLQNSYKKLVHLSVPKFSVESTFSLVNVLQKMGVKDLFSQASQLPFLASKSDSSLLRVDDILQQSILNVDEKGTVAASVTISHVVTLSLNSAPEEIFFKVDQPFLAVIVDKRNKVPLFISKIYDP